MKSSETRKTLSTDQREDLLRTLQARFKNYLNRHQGLDWPDLHAKLEANPEKLWSLHEMEITGGEPDAVGYDRTTCEYFFFRLFTRDPQRPDCGLSRPRRTRFTQRA